MILLIWLVLLISTVAVGVHAAVLSVSPVARSHKDLDRHRISSDSKMGTGVPGEWEEQDGDW